MSLRTLAVALCFVAVVPAGSVRAERLTDEQVKKLIEDVDKSFDTWKADLAKRKLSEAKITSPERTVDVKSFLKDFEKAIEAVKSRFKPANAANVQVQALLRLGSDVERYAQRGGQVPSSTGAALSAKLGTLAGAYGLSWPVDSMNAEAARMNDAELASRVEQMERSAKQLQSEADKAARADKSVDKATREGLKTSIQGIERTAREVRQRVKDDRPAATEVGNLVAQAGKAEAVITRLHLSPAGSSAWQGVRSGTDLLARAYGVPKP